MSEYYTIEQNAGENRVEGGVVGISGSVKNSTTCFGCEYEGEDVYTFERCRLCDIERSNYIPKKEKHYKPFKDCDELKVWFYINKNGISKSVAEELSKITPPSIWVRHKSNKDDQCMITYFGKIETNTISVVEIRGMDLTMKELFENWEFLDGSPVGKLEE